MNPDVFGEQVTLQTAFLHRGMLIVRDSATRRAEIIDPSRRTAIGFAEDAATVKSGWPLTGEGVVSQSIVPSAACTDWASWTARRGVYWQNSQGLSSTPARTYLERTEEET